MEHLLISHSVVKKFCRLFPENDRSTVETMIQEVVREYQEQLTSCLLRQQSPEEMLVMIQQLREASIVC
jgi:hypothetical protein